MFIYYIHEPQVTTRHHKACFSLQQGQTIELLIQTFYSNFFSQECLIDLPKHQYPAKTTGIFLQRLLNSMNKCRLKPLEGDKFSNGRSKLASSFQLFSAFDFSNMDLVRLIYWIFDNRFPESFQLLRCSLSTTNEEVELFFDRINKYSEFRYLILGINTLSLEVQQVWYSLCVHS